MNLTTVREDAAGIIGAALPDEYTIIDHLPDAVIPPTVLIAWSDPWLAPSTYCLYEAAMEILCVAQRIEPGGKLTTLEEMISSILPALKGTGFTIRDVTAPYPLQIGGVDYLAATVNLMYDITD